MRTSVACARKGHGTQGGVVRRCVAVTQIRCATVMTELQRRGELYMPVSFVDSAAYEIDN